MSGRENEKIKGNNDFPSSNFLISIIDNHHLQCVSYLYTNPVDWFKNSLKWCKNSSFKVESFKIFAGGLRPPCTPPPVVVGKQVKDFKEKY